MSTVGDKLRMSLVKRQEAMKRFNARKKAFLASKIEILKDIEEARALFQETQRQLPAQPFSD